MKTNEEDFVTQVFTSSTHDNMLFFTSSGLAYKLKTWKIPESSPTAKGKAIVNLLNLKNDDSLSSILVLPESNIDDEDQFLVFATADGSIRKNSLEDFKKIQANGKIAMKLKNDNSIIGVKICSDNDDLLLSTNNGKCIRTSVAKLRTTKSRSSMGVRGIKLLQKDRIISISILSHMDVTSAEAKAYLKLVTANKKTEKEREEIDKILNEDESEDIQLSLDRFDEMKAREQFILTITENGYGKRTSSFQFRISNRGGSGIMCINTSTRNGNVLASFPVGNDDDIMLITKSGQLIRCPVKDVRIAGRSTQGVSIFKTSENEKVVSASRVEIES
jgi:DNA gyrase subunit A